MHRERNRLVINCPLCKGVPERVIKALAPRSKNLKSKIPKSKISKGVVLFFILNSKF